MKKFKVGDYVSSKCFVGTKKIAEIHCDFATTSDWCNYYLKDLKLVCEFVKGQEVEVSNYKDFSYNNIQKFYSYDSDLKKPYLTTSPSYERIHDWEYCRVVQPKYEPYTEPKLEWLEDGKQIVFKATGMVTHICGIRVSGAKYVLQFGGIHDLPLEECYEKIEWLDSTPFGKEV